MYMVSSRLMRRVKVPYYGGYVLTLSMMSSATDERVITIEFPKPAADLSCGWLVDQAQQQFRELGAPGHLVGLKEFGDKADQEAKVGRT